MSRKLFVNFCHLLNRIGLARFVAGLRWFILHATPRRFHDHWRYLEPKAGYTAGFDVPLFGTMAFVTEDGDVQYMW